MAARAVCPPEPWFQRALSGEPHDARVQGDGGGEAETVGPQDVPADLRELLPAARYRIGFILEPVGAPEEAIAFMMATIAAVGRRFGCVGYDPCTGASVAYARLP